MAVIRLIYTSMLIVNCSSDDTLRRVCPKTCWPDSTEFPVKGACTPGTPVCDDNINVIDCVGYVYPSSEICNNIDDDCDGFTDESLWNECTTLCGAGWEYCHQGSWVDCDAPIPQPEVCDYIDNDCDGSIDEAIFQGLPPSERVCYSGPAGTEEHPPCDYGLLNCINGEIVCTGEITPWIEVCDNIDNDCDGFVDEGVMTVAPPEPSPVLNTVVESNPDILAESMLGSGISLVAGSAVYRGAPEAAGFFTGGIAAGIDIESGIILTTGLVSNALAPNSNDGTGTHNGESGDSDLDNLINANTHDATVLEFRFRTEGGDVYFNYVFASEEYNEFTNSQYNDAFAFILDGVNIAKIPTTTTPVAINTVNGGNPLGVSSSHSELFNNNDRTDGSPPHAIEYDGFTDVLVAAGFSVGAGEHHIKLVIADSGDRAYDSAVFIQGSSFSGCAE